VNLSSDITIGVCFYFEHLDAEGLVGICDTSKQAAFSQTIRQTPSAFGTVDVESSK